MAWLLAALMLLVVPLLSPGPAQAQIPPEWEAAAKVVIGDLERDTPDANKPWSHELRSGWSLARAWRQQNNGNVEIILAEYLTFTTLCREAGCANHTIEGQPYVAVAQQVKQLLAAEGDSYTLATHAHAWLAGLADPTGAAQKNAALWGKDLDVAAADFATGNLYALTWLLAKARHTPAEQAGTFARFALFVQGRGWIGTRCLDIAKVATALDAPPKVAALLMTLSITKVTPAIGAEVSGIDLGSLSNAEASALHDALMAHQVIFFRDQTMSVEQHKALGRLFGDLLVHPAARAELEGHPEIRVVHSDETTKNATGEVWHSDLSCEPEPPMGSILYMHENPPSGGDTQFANMYLAYETLSAPIRRLCESLTAKHSSAHVYSDGAYGRSDKKFPEAIHPVVRTHPVTGRKALFVNRGFTTRIMELQKSESDAPTRDAAAACRDAGIPMPLSLATALGGILG